MSRLKNPNQNGPLGGWNKARQGRVGHRRPILLVINKFYANLKFFWGQFPSD